MFKYNYRSVHTLRRCATFHLYALSVALATLSAWCLFKFVVKGLCKNLQTPYVFVPCNYM